MKDIEYYIDLCEHIIFDITENRVAVISVCVVLPSIELVSLQMKVILIDGKLTGYLD